MTYHDKDMSRTGGVAVLLTGPFGDPERVIALDRPMTVGEVIAVHGLAFRLPTVAVMDGEPVMRGEWAVRMVRPADMLAFVAVPRGGGDSGSTGKQIAGVIAAIALSVAAPWAGAALFGAGTIGAAIFSAAVLAGGSLLLNALFPPPQPPPAAEAGIVYSVNAASNRAMPLEPLPVLYGRLRYPPPYASRPYSEYAGNDQFLYQLFLVTAGKAAIERIDIGETEAWNSVDGYAASFADLEFEIVQPGDEVTLFPANVVTSGEVAGQTVPDPADVLGPFVVNAAGSTIDRIAVDFAFPGGLWTANERAVASNSIPLRAQYREIDDLGAALGGWTNLFAQTISAATRTPQRMTRAADVAPGRYEVRFLADAAFSPDDGTAVNRCVWTGLRGYLTGFETPAGCTLLAMKIRANEQLSQFSSSQVRVTAIRHLPVWDADEWTAPQETRSIAWAAADLLRNTDYSIALNELQYDLGQLAALEAIWTTRGDTFNGLFDRQWTLSDALRAVLRAGRAQPVRIAGRIGFSRLEPKAIKRAVFTPRNVVRGSFEHRLVLFDEEKPDCVTGVFIDGMTWQTREVTASLVAIGADSPQKIEWFGITDHDQAWRESVTEAAVNAYQREFVQFTADWEGKLLVRGDPILVMHPFVEGVETASLADRDGDVLTLDRDLVNEIEGDPYVILRGRDGREWGPCLVDSIDGREVTLDSADRAAVEAGMGALGTILPGEREERAHVLVCDGELRPFNGLVVSAAPNGTGRVAVIAVIDAPQVYLADGTEVMPSPWSPPVLPPAVPLRPVVLGLHAELRAAVAGLELDCMWLPAPGATAYVAEVTYDNGATWTPVYSAASNRFTVPVLPQLLTVRVAAVGQVQGPWTSRVFVEGELPDIRLTGTYLNIDLSDIAAEIQQRIEWIGATARGVIEDFKRLGTLIEEQDAANYDTRQALTREISVKVGGLQASFNEIIEVALGPGGAIAQSLESLYAALGGNTAHVNVRYRAVATPEGVSARWAVEVATDGETFRFAGMYIDIPEDTEQPTRVVIVADQFVVASEDDSTIKPAFVVEDGEIKFIGARAGRITSADGESMIIDFDDPEILMESPPE